eukprot:g3255.t1
MRLALWLALLLGSGSGSGSGFDHAGAGQSHSFETFEDEVLPAWLDSFTVSFSGGRFSYERHSAAPALYGSIDVIHVLATVGALPNASRVRDAWAAQIDSFQNASGFYAHGTSNSRYHAMGEATAALALLGRRPRFNNSAYEAFAARGPADWAPFFDSLYFNNCTDCFPSEPGKRGCGSSIHGCGQVIGSYPSVLAYTTGRKHEAFIRWWAGWIAGRTSPRTGTLCPKNGTRQDLYDSLGGGMATHGIQLGIAGGDPVAYPFALAAPQALLHFALPLQNTSNGVFLEPKHQHDPVPPLGSMSLDGIFQVVRAAEQLQRGGGTGGAAAVAAAHAACDRLLATSAAQLNNKTLTLAKYGGNSHGLPNVLAAVGECARAFPALVRTRRPWTCCARYV